MLYIKQNFIYFQHPGGGDLITEYAGRDATKAFDDFGHSNDAKKLLRPLKIGELVEVNYHKYFKSLNFKAHFQFYFKCY